MNRAGPSRLRITRAPSGWYHYQDIPPIDDYDSEQPGLLWRIDRAWLHIRRIIRRCGLHPRIPTPARTYIAQLWERILTTLFTRR